MKWNLPLAFGEVIGSVVLTLGIMLIAVVVKRKSFGLQSKWQTKIFTVFGVFAVVVVAITTAKGFTAPGAINPAVAIMMGLYHNSLSAWQEKWGLIVIANFIGGLIAAGLFVLFVATYNYHRKHTEKIIVKDIFKFNEQHPVKNISMEFIANFFWMLPIIGMILLHKGDSQSGNYIIPILAGFAVVATLFTTNDIGVANLNPQVWLGEFVVKLVAQRFVITKKQFASEITSLAAVFSVAAMWGGVALGVMPSGK